MGCQVPERWVRIRFFALVLGCFLVYLGPSYGQTPSARVAPSPVAGRNRQISPVQDESAKPNDPQRSGSTQQQSAASQFGTISGTVVDVNDDPIPGASVVLQATLSTERHTVATDSNGFYQIRNVQPGVPYRIVIVAKGFSNWTSLTIMLNPGQYEIVTGSKLRLEALRTIVTVSPEIEKQIAKQQVKVAEKQRGFGIIPNFFTVYSPNPVPLTPKLKFSLAWRVARDPFTFGGTAMIAAFGESAKNPYYGSGWRGFGERFGANYANQFSYLMIGGAILPSLLHQDPRYYYQGTGSTKSRVLHAISAIFITKGDNGHWQPNYSDLGGDLASAAISNSYYPERNRGVGLTFENFGINTAIHMSGRLLQEFVFRGPR
jgi:hypothetical protein